MKEDKILKIAILCPIIFIYIWAFILSFPLKNLDARIKTVTEKEGYFTVNTYSRQSEDAEWDLDVTLTGAKSTDAISATCAVESKEIKDLKCYYDVLNQECLLDVVSIGQKFLGQNVVTDFLGEYLNMAVSLEDLQQIKELAGLNTEEAGVNLSLKADTFKEMKKLEIIPRLVAPKKMKKESEGVKCWFDISRKGVDVALLSLHEMPDGKVGFDVFIKDVETNKILRKISLEFTVGDVDEIKLPKKMNVKQMSNVLEVLVSLLGKGGISQG